MRNIFLFSLVFLFMAGLSFSQIPDPVAGWPYRSQSRSLPKIALGYFADEGIEKHLYYSTLMGEMQKFNLDGSFPSGWPFYCDTLQFGNDYVILDIDHDGRFEMLENGVRWVEGRDIYSLLFLVDDDGSVMPGFPISLSYRVDLAAADMDNDGEYEILYFLWNEQMIYCLDRYGIPKPGWPIPLPYDINCAGGSIGDLDLDGTNEYIISGYRHIYAFRHDGSTMNGFPITLEDTTFIFRNGIWSDALADFDRDGYLDIIMGGNNWVDGPPPANESCFVAVYEHTGQLKAGWPRYFPEWIVSSITPSDIDNNGTIELGFQGYYLHFIGLDGTELPGWPVILTTPDGEIRASYSDLSIVDLDGDGDCEIFSDFNVLYADSLGHDSVWYYGYSYLFAIDHFGQALPGYPLEIEGFTLFKPPVFSLDQSSNRLYMSVSSDITDPLISLDSVFLELYRFPDSTGPPDQWPMLGHDNLHTRNYDFVDRVTSVKDGESEILPKSPILMQNYPNPFNFSTMIQFTLPKREHVTLSIYDILGRKVMDVYNQMMEAGPHRYRLSMDVPSGTYLYRLGTEEMQITRKMTLIK